MAALQRVDNISFVVDVLHVRAGKKLGAIRPDEDGYYQIPLAVLGTATDNRTYYEVEDFVQQLTSPQSAINMRLTDGKLYGEYGHPKIAMLDEKLVLPRLFDIDEPSVSHHIKKIWTGEVLESGGRIIYGLVKPTGPYGESLRANLDDPCMNTSFSLRSIAASRQEGQLTRRRIKHLVTFDYVTAGGYNEASKRFSPGVESLVDIALVDNNFRVTESAMECLSHTELNEIFGAKHVMLGSTRTTFVDKQQALQDADGRLHSVFTSLIGKK
jgi:hypothetical protein